MKKIFILGNPRSGTSLFRLMLNTHSQIVAPPECGFMQWWFTKYKEVDFGSKNEAAIDEFINDFKTSKKIETWELNYQQLKADILKKKPRDYGKLCELVYLNFAKKKNKKPKVIIDKNNYYLHHLYELQTIWPDAKFILLVRDGRDVMCSYKALKNIATNSPYKPNLPFMLEEIAEEWTTNNNIVINFFKTLMNSQHTTLRYEDLIQNTDLVLTKACKYLGLKFEPSMLNYYKFNRKEKEEPIATIDWKKKTLEKPDKANIGKYKHLLKKEEVNHFNKIAHSVLDQFNYEL